MKTFSLQSLFILHCHYIILYLITSGHFASLKYKHIPHNLCQTVEYYFNCKLFLFIHMMK